MKNPWRKIHTMMARGRCAMMTRAPRRKRHGAPGIIAPSPALGPWRNPLGKRVSNDVEAA